MFIYKMNLIYESMVRFFILLLVLNHKNRLYVKIQKEQGLFLKE